MYSSSFFLCPLYVLIIVTSGEVKYIKLIRKKLKKTFYITFRDFLNYYFRVHYYEINQWKNTGWQPGLGQSRPKG